MKLSASRWLALLGALSSRDTAGLSKRTWTAWTSATIAISSNSMSPVLEVTTIPVLVTVSTPVYATTTTIAVIIPPSVSDTTTSPTPAAFTTSSLGDTTKSVLPFTSTPNSDTTATSVSDDTATSASDTATTSISDGTTTETTVSTTSSSESASTPASASPSVSTTSSLSASTPSMGSTSTSPGLSSITTSVSAPNFASMSTPVPATSAGSAITLPSPSPPPSSASTLAKSTTMPSLELFPAPVGTFTLPPGSQTLVISVGSAVVQETGSTTTFLTTLTNTALYVETEGPIISYSDILNMPGATLYVEGDPNMVVSQKATVETTVPVLTSMSCSEAVCSPTPTSMPYTCGIVDGSTQLVTMTMQSYHCTTGQTCEGVPVEIVLACDCGGPICTGVLPLIPLGSAIISIGAPMPPIIPKPPVVPKPPTFPWPPKVPILPIVPLPPLNPTPPTVPEPTPEPEPDPSETTSSEDSTFSETSTFSTTTSSSSSSSSSSTSACSYEDFSIPNDFESTLSAWMSQYPIVLSPFTSMTTQTDSSSSFAPSILSTSSPGSFVTSFSSTISPMPLPSPRPTPAPTSTTMSTSTYVGCDAACSSSSASSAFEAGLSRSMAAGHSSVTQAFASAISAQSASIASASSAQAISTCQHYTLGYPWNPPDIPASLATYNGQSQYGTWMCVVDPSKIETNQEWNSTWKYQPFAVDQGWDTYHPQDTLVDTFCDYLVSQEADVTPDGPVQGVCQAYNRGQCLKSVSSGQCMEWQHPWTTLDFSGSVMISVAYDSNCPVNEKHMPVDFGSVGAQGCKNSLQVVVENCSFPPTMRNNWAQRNDVIGGTMWSSCMVYTIVGIKADDEPNPIWQS